MATVLLSDPDERSRVLLASLIEALGHRVVHEVGLSPVDMAVIEPASPRALALLVLARSRGRHVPVVCVSGRRRSVTSARLDPVAFFDKPVAVGPFVRAVASGARGRRLAAAA